MPEKFNVSLIEVMDLTKRISYVIKEVDIERLGLSEKKLRIVSENTIGVAEVHEFYPMERELV